MGVFEVDRKPYRSREAPLSMVVVARLRRRCQRIVLRISIGDEGDGAVRMQQEASCGGIGCRR